MFLEPLLRRNRAFVEASIHLHREGRIPPNAYVIDLDALEANTRLLASEAHRLGLKVYAMTKQLGRAAGALDAITAGGADGYVAVDMDCARPIVAGGHKLGNLGHLVQISRAETAEAARLAPEYWTIFSRSKAVDAARAVVRRGLTQRVLLRVWNDGDVFYPGHEGGFKLDELPAAIDFVNDLDGLRFAGLTTFPALLYDANRRKVAATPNFDTLARGVERAAALGAAGIEVNAPGTTSTAVLELLADAGATQVEPGHGLTGTTPLHAVEELPEQPAVLYLTEIAHLHQGVPLCFGGGFYVDPVFDRYQTQALVAAVPEDSSSDPVPLELPSPAGIDYYARLHPPANRARKMKEGDTVICAFRVQAFVTRARVAGIRGAATSRPTVAGIWNILGEPVRWFGG